MYKGCFYLELPPKISLSSPETSRVMTDSVKIKSTSLLETRLATSKQIHDNMETHSNEPINTNIDGETSENTFEEKREILHFTEDDRVLTDAVTEITGLPLSLIQYGDEPREHTVVSFLQRPEKIATVTWSTSQAKATNLVSLPIPSTVLTDMYREKLRGFGLLRADIVFKLQFNSQPFQAGRMIATYTPVPAYLINRTTQARSSLCRLTSLPNVVIDISKQTECNITLPYVSSFTHYDLTSGGGDWGLFDLWVYSPLNSASAQTITISIRAYLDNVRLGAPTQQVIVTSEQMLSPFGGSSRRRQTGQPLLKVDAQAGKGGKSAPAKGSFEEVLNRGTESVTIKEETAGPISRTGHKIREAVVKGLNVVGEFIPAINEIRDTVNGVSMGVLNTIAAFGFGKPSNLDKIAPRCLHAFSNFAQATGIDNGHMLALHADNKVCLLPGFAGSNTDELSLTYLLQTLQYYDTHSISTTSEVGTQISAYNVTPFRYDLDKTITAQSYVASSPTLTFGQPNLQWYIGSNFKYWRGDVIMHLALIKTDYHSVRLKIVYDPMATSAAGVSYDASEYCYSVVVDFRDKTDVYIRLPFISATPWKNIPPSTYTGFTPSPANQLEGLSSYSGFVAIFIDNVLQASSAVVSQSVEMVVEFCGASNLDLGFPLGGQNWVPYTTTQVATDETIFAENQGMFAADGIMKTRTNMQENTLDIKNITGMAPRPLQDDITCYTTGEEVYSLRMLMKRFNWVTSVPAGVSTVFLPNTVLFMDNTDDPNVAGTVNDLRTITNGTTLVNDCALVDVVGAMFAFRAGGFRWKVWDNNSEQISAYLVPANTLNAYVPVGSEYNLISNTSTFEIDSKRVKGSAEFGTPFYHPCYTQINSAYARLSGEPDLYFHFTQPQFATVVNRSNTATPMTIAKSAGDDLSFGFLLGVPDCLPSQVATALLGRARPEPSAPNTTPIA